MNYNIEKNLLKTIIFTFIAVISSMIVAISTFYIHNTQEHFETEMKKYVDEHYEGIKSNLKTKINMVIDILDYNIGKLDLSEEELKTYAIEFLSKINFEQNKSNYIFIYEVEKMNGGDDFAKMVVNPNRPDLVGRYISTNYKDGDGKKFREEFLDNIRQSGESYTKYSYKKPDFKGLKYKLSYFKYYEKFNWILAVGVYTDDIENGLKTKKDELESKIQKQIIQNVVIFLMFLAIAILISMAISHEIYKILKNYKQKVIENEKELKVLNKSLEEMMSNIAHQWRQPLSELSSILMFIKLKYYTNLLDNKTIEKKIKEATQVLEYMSNTIDDFRGFFLPTKEKEVFYLYELVNSVISISSRTLENNNIKIETSVSKTIMIETFLNEYQQVALNILKNSKDVLIENEVENPIISIKALEDESQIILTIEDNGGGVLVEPISKIFEAYFTTKTQDKGTGIGLYMSKMIVEKSMKGKITVENTQIGAKFTIIVPK